MCGKALGKTSFEPPELTVTTQEEDPADPPLGDNKTRSGRDRGKQKQHTEGEKCTAVPLIRLFHNLWKDAWMYYCLIENKKPPRIPLTSVTGHLYF